MSEKKIKWRVGCCKQMECHFEDTPFQVESVRREERKCFKPAMLEYKGLLFANKEDALIARAVGACIGKDRFYPLADTIKRAKEIDYSK